MEYGSVLRMFVIICLTIAALMNDLKNFRISNKLILIGSLTGIVLLFTQFISGQEYITYVEGGSLGFMLCYLCYRVHAIGAGDAKLLSVIGLIIGLDSFNRLLLHLAFMTILISAVVLVRNKRQSRRVEVIQGAKASIHVFHFSIVILAAEASNIIFSYLLVG